MHRRSMLRLATGMLAPALAAMTAAAQAPPPPPPAGWPAKPVHIVVGQAAGGGVDTLTRLLAQKLGESLGQPFVVDNKPGAGGVIANGFVAAAPADGYTLMMAPVGSIVFNRILYPDRANAQVQRDLIAVSQVAQFPLLLVVNANQPIRSVGELVAFMKANPAKSNYGGSGPAFQFATELFKLKTDAPAQFIQYKSTGEVITAIIGGDVLLALADTGPATEHIASGRLRALAVTAPRRLPQLPNVPTTAELGLRELDIQFWTGLFAPPGTPAAVVRRLEAEVQRIVRLPDIAERFAAMQVVPAATGSDEFGRLVASDLARWSAVAKSANVKAAE